MSFLRNKTVIITGASMGIGRALAEKAARSGASLVLNARGEDRLQSAAAACRDAGAEVASVPGDCSRYKVGRDMVQAAQSMGGYSGFIHAAGVLKPGPYLWELPQEDYAAVFAASVGGAFSLIKAGIEPLLEQPGAFTVFFGSGAAEITQPGIAAYCAAKAAEEHTAKQLQAEAPSIAVLIYRPGIVETRMQSQARNASGGAASSLHEIFGSWKENGMLITPEESAEYLLSVLEKGPDFFKGRTIRAGDS